MAKRNVEKMGKAELRAACKAAGISYGKLSVAMMREELMLRAAAAANAEDSKPAKRAAVVTTAPQVAREERNGVKRPRAGGLCAAVWDALDQLRAAGIEPSSKDARDLAVGKGWNTNNALAELSGWRRFNGLARQVKKKRKSAAKEAVAVVTEAAVAS